MPDPRQAVIKAALNGDIVGFSRLMADDFVSTTVLVTTLREGRAEVAAGGGTLVNFVGDSFIRQLDPPGIGYVLGEIGLSMDSLGSALDNAVVESFFATIKRERLDERFTTRAHAHRAIAEWIEVFYNLRRRHSFLGYHHRKWQVFS